MCFDASVLETFAKYAQIKRTAPESGGILVGTQRGRNLEILVATVPVPTDRQTRYSFERNTASHSDTAKQLWFESMGTVRYLGEWHTHPEDVPYPSMIDRCEWTLLARARKDGSPLLTVIVGRDELHVELVYKGFPAVVLNPIS